MVRPMVKIESGELRRVTVLGMLEELNNKNINRNMITREAKISYVTLQNWINKTHRPSVKHLKKISKVHEKYCGTK